MIYPYSIINKEIYPVFDNQIKGSPLYVDLSIKNPIIEKICKNKTQQDFDKWIWKTIKEANKSWAVSGYLENRASLLQKYPQMVEQNRVYHLGLDITVPKGFILYAPLDGEVVISEYESGEGNYGGIVVLRHKVDGDTFYSVYGHLNRQKLPNIGNQIKIGESFAETGDFDTNGNWFYHTHLQILTEKAYNQGWVHKGYCTEKELTTIAEYCPDSTFLFKY